jgi:NADH-quinone oxidoreductase subunit L
VIGSLPASLSGLAAEGSTAGLEATPASGAFSLMWVIIALPLLGALLLLAFGRRFDRIGHWLGVATVAGSFAVALWLFLELSAQPEEERAVSQQLWSWIPVGDFQADVALLLDPLSTVFVLLITGVGLLIHIYSVAYMDHDRDRRRFFGYMNLFVAAMLLLVLADNYLLLYVGWEGVGLASYLLIGFWNQNPVYATAAKKAFIVNRVGDFGLSVAIMVMFATFGSFAFSEVFAAAPDASETTLTVIGLLLLLAACGKSAQVPLQSWLLDAMAGPTPVSALIHAATMVTAGVYLITRSNAIFDLAPGAQLAVVIVGVVTMLFGAVIGCAKDDIKKALAASTMSQIGYMIIAVGLGPIGYVFGIMHLLTHGFFKAGMFLGAGSVMHGMNDQVDMRKYGGLRALMPITFATFGLGYLAIIGIPPFSGFFSKDKIIESALADSWWVGGATILAAGITAFYMTRVMIMTFFGPRRWEDDAHPHESPSLMTGPMILLAVGSVGAGAFLALGNRLELWLEPVTGFTEPVPPLPIWVITGITLAVVGIGVLIAYLQYAARPVPDTQPAGSLVTVAARNDLYGDAFNEAVFMRPGMHLTRTLVFFDNKVVDGAVGVTAATIGGLSGRMRRLQTGYVRSYALTILAGAVAVAAAVLLVRL